jgi:hypothetical protein
MPKYHITSPDGKEYEIDAPEGATEQDAISYIQKNHAKEPDISHENPIIEALRGASARGNEAFAAINPWADQEKVAAEKEWVKQHPGAADIGSMLSDIAITAPAGFGSGLGARALLSGGLEGLTHTGSNVDRLKETAYGALGSGIGEGVGNVASFLLKPFGQSKDKIVNQLVRKADDLGIPLNAAQTTGNKSLQYADSALDFIPSSSAAQQEFKDMQRKKWTEAILKQGGETADNVGSDVMGGMKDRISGVYKDLTSRNNLNVDDKFISDLANVKTNLMGRIPTNQKGIVKSYLADLGSIPAGQAAQINGSQYQNIRSMLDKQAKAFKNTDPATHEALMSIKKAADSAMERSLVNPVDAAKWKGANKDWAVMRTIEKAVDPTTGQLSPNLLMNSMKNKDANRVIYGKGDQELTDIAKVGKQFISSKTADSGTAQRAMMMKMLTGGGLGGLGTMAMYDPTMAAEAGTAALLGGVLMPKLAGKMMRTQGGYLTKGLVDLGKEALPGITREKVIIELMRNAGVQALADTE